MCKHSIQERASMKSLFNNIFILCHIINVFLVFIFIRFLGKKKIVICSTSTRKAFNQGSAPKIIKHVYMHVETDGRWEILENLGSY